MEDLWGLVGTVLTVLALVGGAIVRDRQVFKAIEGVKDSAQSGDDVLHNRIGKVKDDYVRRADLDGHIKRLEENVKELRNDIRHQSEETNKRLDLIIAGFFQEMSISATDIAAQAAALVGGDREKQHGSKLENFTKIATLWNAWLDIRHEPGTPLDAHDIAQMMVLTKIARTQSGNNNIDDYVDAAGYSACAGEVVSPRGK